MEAIRQWQDPGKSLLDHAQSKLCPVKLHQLIRAQNLIDWRQLLNGRFCQQWGDIQNEYLYRIRHHFMTKNTSGQKWQVAIITVNGNNGMSYMKLRNDDVHGKDTAARASAEKREVLRQRTHMEPSAQSLLFPDIRPHLEQPKWVIHNWLTINGPVRAKAIQNVRSIRTYFAPR
jgi:hypothetical protein